MVEENGSSTVDINGIVTADFENVIDNLDFFLEQLNDSESEESNNE